jgi:glycosyltransferase involved in cell wall biosynthesis
MKVENARPVSVIIPARNEEANIATAVRSVARQSEVLEILVVDDQSTDLTPIILQDLRNEISALRVITVNSLPPGWLGKANALACAAGQARGDWLLFTDADAEHMPGSLEALLQLARGSNAALLSLSPGQKTVTWWEKAVIPLVFVELARLFRFEEVNDQASEVAAANGQFILVQRQIYQEVGGHEAGRAEILEDVDLARRIKSAGNRILFMPGTGYVATRMYRTYAEMWSGWTKNLYLLYRGSLRRMLRAGAAHVAVWLCGPLVVLFILGFALLHLRAAAPFGLAALAGALYGHFSYRRALRRIGFSPRLSPYFFLGAPLFAALLVNSFRAHRVTGAVAWKGRTYPIKGTS